MRDLEHKESAPLAKAHGKHLRRVRRDGTVNIRIPKREQQLIDTAADALGKTRSEFMIECARQKAVDVLLDYRLFVLEPEQYDALVAALDNPQVRMRS